MHEIASVKPGKFPRAVALNAVREILAVFTPSCYRVVVAGSLRRRKDMVGDAEILYIPHCCVESDLLGEEWLRHELTDSALAILLERDIIEKRKNSKGSTMWGDKNKFATHRAAGVPIDFFRATPENWWNYLVCRTGPAESNIKIASAAERQGMKWHPYGQGFTKGAHWLTANSEQDVFSIAGLPYLEPWER